MGCLPLGNQSKNFSSLDSENLKIYFCTAAFYKREGKKKIHWFQDSLSWFDLIQSYILFQFYSKWICLISIVILCYFIVILCILICILWRLFLGLQLYPWLQPFMRNCFQKSCMFFSCRNSIKLWDNSLRHFPNKHQRLFYVCLLIMMYFYSKNPCIIFFWGEGGRTHSQGVTVPDFRIY